MTHPFFYYQNDSHEPFIILLAKNILYISLSQILLILYKIYLSLL